MNPGAFLMRGLDNVRTAFSLTAVAYNLWRAINILGVDVMMAAGRHPAPECSNIVERSFASSARPAAAVSIRLIVFCTRNLFSTIDARL